MLDLSGYVAGPHGCALLEDLGALVIKIEPPEGDHPSQVPLANAVFRPSDAEIAAASRVVEAARAAEVSGVGGFVVDGRMIDLP